MIIAMLLCVLCGAATPVLQEAGLRPGATLRGVIEAEDAEVRTDELIASGRGNDPPAAGRAFPIEAEDPGTYHIELRSDFFDAYLIVRDAAGRVVVEGDDGLPGTHARVVFELSADEHLEVVACALDGDRGPFELTMNAGVPTPIDPADRLEADLAEAVRRLHVLEETFGPVHPEVAGGLIRLGNVLSRAGAYADARTVYQQALEIQEQTLGEGHRELSTTWNNLGIVHQLLGDFEAARDACERALQIDEVVLGPDHPTLAASLNSLATLLQTLGRLDEAQPMLERARTIVFDSLGPEHEYYGWTLNNLGVLHRDKGELGIAREYMDEGLSTLTRILGEGDPRLCIVLNNLALVHTQAGDHVRARVLLERSLSNLRASVAPTHPDVGWTLHVLGMVQLALGDTEEAQRSLEEALAIREQSLGPGHPDVAQSQALLAAILATVGRVSEARELMQRALSVFEARLGETHPYVALGFHNLAQFAWLTGDKLAALELQERALALQRRSLGPRHPEVANGLNNLSVNLRGLGRLEQARASAVEALALAEDLLGPSNRVVAEYANNLAGILLDLGDAPAARRLVARTGGFSDRHFITQCAGLTEHEQLLFIEELADQLALALSPSLFGDGDGDGDGLVLVLAYERQLAWKARLLRWARTGRARLRAGLTPEVGAKLDRLQELNSLLSRSTTALLSGAVRPPERDVVLLEEHGRLQRELQGLLGDEPGATLSWRELRDALPDHCGLVDFFVHHQYVPARREGEAVLEVGRWTVPHVIAWITRPRLDAPVYVDLGEAAAIEAAITAWRASIAGGATPIVEPQVDPAMALARLVWTPLEHHLVGIDQVFVSPDGALATVGFGALPDGRGQHLIESRSFVSLTDPTTIARCTGARPRIAGDLVAIGGVDYEQVDRVDGSTADEQGGVGPPSRAVGEARGGWTGRWEALPHTADEMRRIAALHAVSVPDSARVMLSGAEASEEAVKRQLPHGVVLHIATHGYFDASLPGADPGSTVDDVPRRLGLRHPGLLAGVVCAGANARPAGDHEDGFLTAEEVAWMDLDAAQLVVLSACDTALGKPRAGEGLMGLRRAFLAAGARTVVSSLWSIPDRQTGDVMERFYANLWLHRMPALEALRAAQLAMIAENRERYGQSLPATWAAFVLDGDWR